MMILPPLLLPKAVAWAEKCSADILSSGVPLDAALLAISHSVGVNHPEHIRILTVNNIPLPDDPDLLKAAVDFKLLGPHTAGLTLGYGIYIRNGFSNIRLLSHEFRHVYQYEQAGSIESFLAVYIPQVFQYGYHLASLEADARCHEIQNST